MGRGKARGEQMDLLAQAPATTRTKEQIRADIEASQEKARKRWAETEELYRKEQFRKNSEYMASLPEPPERWYTAPSGNMYRLQPGEWYHPFPKMDPEMYRRLPLRLQTLRCSTCFYPEKWPAHQDRTPSGASPTTQTESTPSGDVAAAPTSSEQ